MARSSNQKQKLLYLMQMLLEQTDEAHPLSMEAIQAGLHNQNIAAERKSIYDDIEALRSFGLDICLDRRRGGGYYVGSRTFELAELKLLVDSVQASKFITERKTLSLIKKLMSLGSVHEGAQLRRQVFVQNRIKSMNESIYYNVDRIHSAIAEDKQIAFRYFDYDAGKQKRYRHGGGAYVISPLALMWDQERYYMIGYDGAAEMRKHYRVDKMDHIDLTALPRQGKQLLSTQDLAAYTRRTFGMFGGEESMVTLRFPESLVGVMLDKFGKEIILHPAGEGLLRITVPIALSPQFYAWVFGLGGQAAIEQPAQAVEGFLAQLKENMAQYTET